MVFSVDIISDSYTQVEDLFPWIFRNSLNLIHPISNPALSFMINQAGTVKAKMYSVMAEDSPGLVAGPRLTQDLWRTRNVSGWATKYKKVNARPLEHSFSEEISLSRASNWASWRRYVYLFLTFLRVIDEETNPVSENDRLYNAKGGSRLQTIV